MSGHVIEITNLSKFYGKFRGIEDVSFTVDEGEIYGFIGPNGAGKSTTIRTLLALIHPTSGKATIFGKDCIREADVIAKDVGYLPSESSYHENMKVRELLDYSAALYGKDCTRRIKELSERLNLDTSRKIHDLSFGNKKKVGIVSALLHSPKLIILDEPTSGLDPLVQQTFFNILKEENAKGATILFSSHVLSEMQNICGTVLLPAMGAMEILPQVVATSFGMFFTQCVFMSIGMLSAAFAKSYKTGLRYSFLVLIAAYVAGFAIELNDAVHLDFLSPTRYFNVPSVAQNGISPLYLLVAVIVAGISLCLTLVLYKKKDLHA